MPDWGTGLPEAFKRADKCIKRMEASRRRTASDSYIRLSFFLWYSSDRKNRVSRRHEKNRWKAAACIQENLRFTKLSDRARVLTGDAAGAIYQLAGEGKFDIIFMDPPYNLGLEEPVLAALRNSPLADSDTLVILENAKNSNLSWIEESGFSIEKIKTYKTNRHLFLRRENI